MKKRFYLSTLIPMGAVLCFVLCGTLILNAGYGFLWVPAEDTFGKVYAHTFFSFYTLSCIAMFMAALFFSLRYFLYAVYHRRIKTVIYVLMTVFSVGGLIALLVPMVLSALEPLYRLETWTIRMHSSTIVYLVYLIPAGIAKIGVLLSSVVLLFTFDPTE